MLRVRIALEGIQKQDADWHPVFVTRAGYTTYRIESRFAVSLLMVLVLSAPMVVPAVPALSVVADVDSVTVLVVVSLVADFSVEQAVASRVIARKKKADFAMFIARLWGYMKSNCF